MTPQTHREKLKADIDFFTALSEIASIHQLIALRGFYAAGEQTSDEEFREWQELLAATYVPLKKFREKYIANRKQLMEDLHK